MEDVGWPGEILLLYLFPEGFSISRGFPPPPAIMMPFPRKTIPGTC